MGSKVALPFVGMIMAECAQVGLMIISKIALSKGMSSFMFTFYSNALASLILLPLSFLFHRSDRPPLSFSIVSQFFLLGLLGCVANISGYAGINLSSPTLGTSMLNLVPGLIFILAVLFRLEKLDLRTSSALAKSVGTVVSIGGAFVMTYYRGPPVVMTHLDSSNNQLLLQLSNWVIGGFLLAVDALSTSAWVIVQAIILKKYHAELIVVFFYCFFNSILSAIVCLVVERDPSAWSLKPNIRAGAILYSGVFGSVFQVGIVSWCLRQTGPVFVSMFKPLGIVIAAATGVIFSGDNLYLGSLVGATVIIIGFYAVIWGKFKEQNIVMDDRISNDSSSQNHKVPLLESHVEEIEAFSEDNQLPHLPKSIERRNKSTENVWMYKYNVCI